MVKLSCSIAYHSTSSERDTIRTKCCSPISSQVYIAGSPEMAYDSQHHMRFSTIACNGPSAIVSSNTHANAITLSGTCNSLGRILRAKSIQPGDKNK